MPVEFKEIGPQFTDRGLKVPKLNVLVPDNQLYDVLAIQPVGRIAARRGFIGHEDRQAANARFDGFFCLAFAKNCDLVLAPEYSCPWESLTKIIAAKKLPKAGNVWILGCEGIAPDDLKKVIENCPNVVWIHEPFPGGTGSLYGVVAYVTQTEANDGTTKNVIVLQFKTNAMGGNPLERDHLIPGQVVYVWQNSDKFIRLVTIICADAMAFDQARQQECRCDVDPTIIFHPQLTADPHHAAMCEYRGRLFLQDTDRLEVISLNWARGFVIPKTQENPYGASAIYTKARLFDTSDARLNANHKLGLYFTNWETRRTKLAFFNFNEHVFHYRMPKVALRGPAVQAQRTGPEMLALWQWRAADPDWIPCGTAADGFTELCGGYGDGAGDYCLDTAFSHLDRERLFALSAGGFKPHKEWYKVEVLPSFVSEADERCKRLTFTHEQVDASRRFRDMLLTRYSRLQAAVISSEANFPENIQDLKNDCVLRPPIQPDEFRYNLRDSASTLAPATGIFLGQAAPNEARKMFDNVVREWEREKTRRLVVWYERANGQIAYLNSPLPSISDDSESPGSIASGGDS